MIRILSVPYHLGHHGQRMGRGPDHLLAAGLVHHLQERGHDVDVATVLTSEQFSQEIDGYFGVQRALARHVARAHSDGVFPFVLGGNCGCVLGSLLGGDPGRAVIWFDAHADATTPDSTTSGFLDGMALATVLGQAWHGLARSIPGFAPVDPARTLLVGARAIEPLEEQLLGSLGVRVIGPELLAEQHSYRTALLGLARRATTAHVHIDLDVIDSADGIANDFAAGGGPSVPLLKAAVRAVGATTMAVSSVSLASYDPECDSDGRAADCALGLAAELAGLAVAQP